MFLAKIIGPNFPDLDQIKDLYEEAFPARERRPLQPLLSGRDGISAVIAFYDEGLFVGFSALLFHRDIAHIIYLAIVSSLRGRGYGRKALRALDSFYRDYRLVADIELEEGNGPEAEKRQRRHRFYLENGYDETDIFYEWHGDRYQILVRNGHLTAEEFESFWAYMEKKGLIDY